MIAETQEAVYRIHRAGSRTPPCKTLPAITRHRLYRLT